MEGKRKYRGGADKNREKQRKLLKKEAGKCKNISDMFYHKSSCSGKIPIDQVVKAVINDPSFENDNDQVIQPDNSEIVTSTVQNKLCEENTVFENDPARFIKIKSWTQSYEIWF